jgi:general stress protein 26
VDLDKAAIYAFMAGCRRGVLSSTSGDGTPQSALMGIAVTPALEIIFDTKRSSRKYANLIRRPACSFVVGWEGEQTVQYEGIAAEPEGEALRNYLETYFAVWPGGRERMNSAGITFFVVRPTWIRYCDYDQRPPVLEEIVF